MDNRMNTDEFIELIRSEIEIGNYDKAVTLLYIFEQMSKFQLISL